jgi:cell division protein FtsB
MVNAAQQSQSGRFGWPLWQFVLLFVLIVLALSGDRGLIASYKTGLYRAELASNVDVLRAANAEQRKEIYALKNDRAYLEDIARKERGMVREDEIVYQFARDEATRK